MQREKDQQLLTQDGCHRQNEQLQQGVLLLIGQTQEAHLGHLNTREAGLTYDT